MKKKDGEGKFQDKLNLGNFNGLYGVNKLKGTLDILNRLIKKNNSDKEIILVLAKYIHNEYRYKETLSRLRKLEEERIRFLILSKEINIRIEEINIQQKTSFEKIKKDYWSELSNEYVKKSTAHQFDKLDSELLRTTSAEANFFILLPKDSGYEKTFGQKYNAKAESEMRTASDRFTGLPYKNVEVLNTFTRASLLEAIRSNHDKTTVIVAHSEQNIESKNIKLSDGATISVAELHKEGVSVHSPVIIVTCHGKDIGVQREISIRDAYRICSSAIEAINSGKAKNASEVVAYMRIEANFLRRREVTIKITIMATIGGELVTIAFTYGTGDDD